MNVSKYHRKKFLWEERAFKPNHPHTQKNLLSRQFYNQEYELHNTDGPAVIIYDNGVPIREEYYLWDKKCTKNDILKLNRKWKLKRLNSKTRK